MMKIRKRVWVVAIILGLVGAGLNYVRLFYFPWENGYRVYSDQRLGYQDARLNKLKSTKDCEIEFFSKEYLEGCKAYLKNSY